MLRKMLMILMSSYICPGNCFKKFKMDFVREGYTCSDFEFDKPRTLLSKCAVLCATKSECKRFFFIPDDNSCVGCSTFESQLAQAKTSIAYVPWDHLTYRYLGCYTDFTNYSDRVLNGSMIETDNMTSDFCFKYCIVDRGYLYFGLQNYNECYCGNSTQEGTRRPDDDCTTTCLGDQTQQCGGHWRNSVYELY